MSSFAGILPGARVRNADGFLGTVERLDSAGAHANGEPDQMIVRAEDGRWRYALPLFLVRHVAHQPLHVIVTVSLKAEELPHYIFEEIGDGAATNADTHTQDDAETLVAQVPLAVEELFARKAPIVRGNVHIHKSVETTEQRIPITLFHEEAVVEHIPLDQYDADAPVNPNEVMIPILEERLIVQKQSVVKEYLRIRKQIVEKQNEVRGAVRREVARVTEQRNTGIADDDAPLLRNPEALAPGQMSGAQTRRRRSKPRYSQR